MGQIDFPTKSFVNSDVETMALSLIEEAHGVRDDDPRSMSPSVRRAHLLRASSHLLNAFAELQAMKSRESR